MVCSAQVHEQEIYAGFLASFELLQQIFTGEAFRLGIARLRVRGMPGSSGFLAHG